MFAVVNNLPRFGGGMRIAPEARIDDGLLDLVIVREIPKSTLLSIFPKVYSGKHVGHPAVTMVRTRRAEITIDRAMTMYGGGEPLLPMEAGVPVAVEVVPGGLAIVGSPARRSIQAPTLNSTPCASGSSVPQLIVQVWRRM